MSELEPVPLLTLPPDSDSVGAALRASDAVTITAYVEEDVPYCPFVTLVTAIELMVGAAVS